MAWPKGQKRTPESIEKMRKAAEGRPSPMEGRHHTPESIEKMRQTRLGKKKSPMSQEGRRAIAAVRQDKALALILAQKAQAVL